MVKNFGRNFNDYFFLLNCFNYFWIWEEVIFCFFKLKVKVIVIVIVFMKSLKVRLIILGVIFICCRVIVEINMIILIWVSCFKSFVWELLELVIKL